jgi:pilus assembly protein Flp/PilA
MLLHLYAYTKVTLAEFAGRAHARTADLMNSETGATAAEYALLVALIAVAIIAGAKALGGSINSKLSTTATTIGSP